MIKRLAAASLLACAATAASAQDIVDWTGFQVGVVAGFGEGAVATSGNFIETTGVLMGLAPGTLPWMRYTGADRLYANNGWSGGVFAGYDVQVGSVVLGIGADIQRTSIYGEDAFVGSPEGPAYYPTEALDWYGTVRGRVGMALGNALPFFTAGLAFGQTTTTLLTHGGIPGAPVGPSYFDSSTDFRTGYVLGGGIELAIGPSWSIRAEYLHMNLGSVDLVFALPTADDSIAGATNANTYDLLRVAIGRRF